MDNQSAGQFNGNKFPKALLLKSNSIRLEYFANKIIQHDIINQVLKDVMHAIRYPTKASMITVCGPTGVGKTTLLRRVLQQVDREIAAGQLGINQARHPGIMVEVPAPILGYFKWRDFHIRLLPELDRLLDNKVNVAGMHHGTDGQLIIGSEVKGDLLNLTVEESLRQCQLAVLIADEAPHIAKIARGSRLVDQMDVIKSLASLAQTRPLLAGTYELIDMINLNGQACRRSVDIHFRRYHYDNEDERKQFLKVLQTFQYNLPFPETPNLLAHAEYLYEGCLGCIGVLKDWLYRASATAMEENNATLTLAHLEHHTLSFDKLVRMARELRSGEILRNKETRREQLREILGMKTANNK